MTPSNQKSHPPEKSRPRIEAPPKAPPKHSTIEVALADALAGYGVTLAPKASGRFERFDAPDKPKGNGNGWYRIHSPQAASFGIWHLDVSEVVTLNDVSNSEAVAQSRLEAIRERDRRDRKRQQCEAQAAEKARRWWSEAAPGDPAHPWLARKRLPPHALRQHGKVLLVPLYVEGGLVNLERIFPDGNKRTLAGGRVRGVASLIGRLTGAGRVLVAEGWSTAAALHEVMGCPVVVARNADNLALVARRLRQRLPDADITICGDDDRHLPAKGKPNKGSVEARHAALAIGADLLMPSFCEGCRHCTDFADVRLCRLGGGHGG